MRGRLRLRLLDGPCCLGGGRPTRRYYTQRKYPAGKESIHRPPIDLILKPCFVLSLGRRIAAAVPTGVRHRGPFWAQRSQRAPSSSCIGTRRRKPCADAHPPPPPLSGLGHTQHEISSAAFVSARRLERYFPGLANHGHKAPISSCNMARVYDSAANWQRAQLSSSRPCRGIVEVRPHGTVWGHVP